MAVKNVRMTESMNLRRRLMSRATDYIVRVEEDTDYNPSEYDCYTSEDLAKFSSGQWRTWGIVIYRACFDHHGLSCPHVRIVDSLWGIDVASSIDISGDYVSPYFISEDYVRAQAWDMWQDRKKDESVDYVVDVLALVDGFRYELCPKCGCDLNRHTISPDMFGKPHAWCLTAEQGDV